MRILTTTRWLAVRACQLGTGESSGQALIEFALVAPLILLLALGMCVFGIGLNEQLTVTNATELAAQQLAISRGQTTSTNTICDIVQSTFDNAAPSLNATQVTFSLTLSDQTGTGQVGTISATGATGASGFEQATGCSADTLIEGQNLTLTVSYPYTASFINFGTKSYTLSSTIEQVIE